ncbi:thermonuclease family protein [uncultured Methanobrevibacter sp.]|uniref:thermonuclease family protein n=1 Tax=uncultured Methanobrevibacter sp. TaxID=253161 RepID=UPI0025D7E4AA|nr:thermonuclease family protein [uncultured Methanobrevibacter sp.]
MKGNWKKILLFLIFLIIAIETLTIASAYTGTGFSHNITSDKYTDLSISDILNKYNDTDCVAEKSGICTKVVDGDTIYLDTGEKVRLVGVNTPEKGVQGADTSKYFVEKLCLNREVSLDVDDSKHTDRYGRTLAVVIVDGKNLNEMLLKEGLAEVMYMPPSEFYPYDWTNGNTPTSSSTSASAHTSSNTNYSNTDSNADSNTNGEYIGNANTMKFHLSTCPMVNKMSENSKVSFSSRQSAIDEGYTPCKVCNP